MADTPFEALFDAPWMLLIVWVVVMAAAIVQAGLGMGFGLTSAPLLAVIDPVLVPAPTLLLGLATATWGAFAERKAINWTEVRIAAAARAGGSVLAALVLVQLADQDTFSLVFGLLIALAVLLVITGRRLPFTMVSLSSMGAISGFMGTITSVGAPPLALVYQGRPAATSRPTLAAFFAIGCAISLIVLFANGWADTRDLALALFMSIPMMCGLLVSRRLKGRFDQRYTWWLRGVSAIAACILVYRGIS